MDTHKNARLTPKGREEMVRAVVDGGLSKAAAARKYNTTPKTVAKWVNRFRAESVMVCAIDPRVRGRIEAVLDFAKTRGYRMGENPAAWDGNLVHTLPARSTIVKVDHHAALPFTEVPAFMAQLAIRAGSAARALEFLILTAARTVEVIGACWSEIDLDAKLWTIPAERMKARKEHRVPLSTRAIEILNALPREVDFVFPGGRKAAAISNMAMAQLLKRMGRSDITVHGFRSTFRDWAAERTNYPNHVVEMALAHVIGDKIEAAYRRGDLFAKRTRLMSVWTGYCTAPQRDFTVTPIRARGPRTGASL
jgi:integrase